MLLFLSPTLQSTFVTNIYYLTSEITIKKVENLKKYMDNFPISEVLNALLKDMFFIKK